MLNRGSCIPAGDSAGVFRHCSIPGLSGLLQVHLQHKQFCVSSHNFPLRIANCSLSFSGSDLLYYPSSQSDSASLFSCHPLFLLRLWNTRENRGPSPPLHCLTRLLSWHFTACLRQIRIWSCLIAVPFRSSLPSLSVNEDLTGQGLKMPVNSRTELFVVPFRQWTVCGKTRPFADPIRTPFRYPFVPYLREACYNAGISRKSRAFNAVDSPLHCYSSCHPFAVTYARTEVNVCPGWRGSSTNICGINRAGTSDTFTLYASLTALIYCEGPSIPSDE